MGGGCYKSLKFPRGGSSVHVHINANTFIHIVLSGMQIKLYLHIISPILVSKVNSVHQYFVVLEHIF